MQVMICKVQSPEAAAVQVRTRAGATMTVLRTDQTQRPLTVVLKLHRFDQRRRWLCSRLLDLREQGSLVPSIRLIGFLSAAVTMVRCPRKENRRKSQLSNPGFRRRISPSRHQRGQLRSRQHSQRTNHARALGPLVDHRGPLLLAGQPRRPNHLAHNFCAVRPWPGQSRSCWPSRWLGYR